MMTRGIPIPLTVLVALMALTLSADAVELVQHGKPVSTIVIPDSATEVVRFAAQELAYHIEKSTGAALPIVNETAKPSGNGLIYLGPCRATSSAGIRTDSVGISGSIIRVVGPDFYLVGDDSDGPVFDRYGTTMGCFTRMGTLFAVYEFLEKHMKVRWLWPGRLGEVIPRRTDIRVTRWNQTRTPQIIHSRFRDGGAFQGSADAWSSESARAGYVRDQTVWLRRHRFSSSVNLNTGHAFTGYWKRFSETHREFFNLLPDGTRRSDPNYFDGTPELISMCVSEPGFWRQVVEDWKASRTSAVRFINACENDTNGRCVCERCMSWDVPTPDSKILFDQRLAQAKEAFGRNDGSWSEKLGSLSDRYARFYLSVQKEAESVDPEATVVAYAYANYSAPPIKTKLNDRVIIGLVSSMGGFAAFRNNWDSWASTGCRLLFRPNDMLQGHNLPYVWPKGIGKALTYAAEHGLIATDFDSLTGQWATQGPNLYVVAQKNAHPGMPVERLLDEYFGGFGPANKQVKAYFSHWETITESIAEKYPQGHDDLSYAWFYRGAGLVYTPEVMEQGRILLAKAVSAAKGDVVAAERVSFLEKGLRNAELTLAVQEAYVRYTTTGDMERYGAALERLDEFRKSVDAENVCNMGFLARAESRTWDRSFAKLMKQRGKPLNASWKFMWDPTEEGVAKSWQAEDFDDSGWHDIDIDTPWEKQPVGEAWREEHGSSYDGIAWYRTSITLDPSRTGQRVGLIFGAVDEACQVWVNGKQLLDRPFPYKGNPNSWQEAFQVDFTSVARFDRPNVIVVRVEDRAGAGGIWKPVWLTADAAR